MPAEPVEAPSQNTDLCKIKVLDIKSNDTTGEVTADVKFFNPWQEENDKNNDKTKNIRVPMNEDGTINTEAFEERLRDQARGVMHGFRDQADMMRSATGLTAAQTTARKQSLKNLKGLTLDVNLTPPAPEPVAENPPPAEEPSKENN